jgi:hypothetical protein
MTATASAKRALIEDRLGTPVAPLIRQFRRDDRSWRWIAAYLSERSGVPVSHVAVRRYAQHSGGAAA